jgi:hypothetical protein
MALLALASVANADTRADDIDSVAAPSNPAFTALDKSPNDVLVPSSIEQIGADVFAGLDSSGTIQPGVGVEVAPIWLFATGKNTTLQQWRDDKARRIASNTTVSLATSKVSGNSRGVAGAIRVGLWDASDPRWDKDAEACVQDAVRPIVPSPSPTATTLPTAPDNGLIKVTDSTAVSSCLTSARARRANASSGSFAVAVTGASDSGDATATVFDSATVWFSLAEPFGGTKDSDGRYGGKSLLELAALAKVDADGTLSPDLGVGWSITLRSTRLGLSGIWIPTYGDGAFSPAAASLGSTIQYNISDEVAAGVKVTGQVGPDAPDPGLNIALTVGLGAKHSTIPLL